MDGIQRGKSSVDPDRKSEELMDRSRSIIRCLDRITDTAKHMEGSVNRICQSVDNIDRVMKHILEQVSPAVSEVERIRVPIQRETRRVRVRRDPDQRETFRRLLQRGVTESIEIHQKRPRPTCPTFNAEQIQKVEINDIPKGRCRICLDDFQADQMDVCVIVPCSHTFHKACVMKWLEDNNVCPICRFAFPTKRIRVQ